VQRPQHYLVHRLTQRRVGVDGYLIKSNTYEFLKPGKDRSSLLELGRKEGVTINLGNHHVQYLRSKTAGRSTNSATAAPWE
jgi:hypothetical protein